MPKAIKTTRTVAGVVYPITVEYAYRDGNGNEMARFYATAIVSVPSQTTGDAIYLLNSLGERLSGIVFDNSYHSHTADIATSDGDGNVITETYATKTALATTDGNVAQNASDIADLDSKLNGEIKDRQDGDGNLQSQIDAINATQNVVDIVGTHAELLAYDTSYLHENDKIEVMDDESQDDANTIYSWDGTAWILIGSKAAYYSKAETDAKDNHLQDQINYIGTGGIKAVSSYDDSTGEITFEFFDFVETSYDESKAELTITASL